MSRDHQNGIFPSKSRIFGAKIVNWQCFKRENDKNKFKQMINSCNRNKNSQKFLN